MQIVKFILLVFIGYFTSGIIDLSLNINRIDVNLDKYNSYCFDIDCCDDQVARLYLLTLEDYDRCQLRSKSRRNIINTFSSEIGYDSIYIFPFENLEDISECPSALPNIQNLIRQCKGVGDVTAYSNLLDFSLPDDEWNFGENNDFLNPVFRFNNQWKRIGKDQFYFRPIALLTTNDISTLDLITFYVNLRLSLPDDYDNNMSKHEFLVLIDKLINDVKCGNTKFRTIVKEY